MNENTIEQDFFICNDLEGCEALLKKAGTGRSCGNIWCDFSGIKKGLWAGLALGEDGKCIMFLWRNGNSSLFKMIKSGGWGSLPQFVPGRKTMLKRADLTPDANI